MKLRKCIYWLIGIMCMCPALLHAQELEDSRYLEGAVPEVNGKVVFSKEYNISGMSQQEIMRRTQDWMEKLLERNRNNSRIVLTDETQGLVVGMQDHYLVFSNTALSLDRTRMVCQLTATAQPESLKLELSKIRYIYKEGKEDNTYPAEEMISDEYALNKAHTKLSRGYAKWRRKTVDYVDSLYLSLADAMSATQESIKRDETTNQAVRSNQQVVVVNQTTVKAQPAVTPSKEESSPKVEVKPAVTEPAIAETVTAKAEEKPMLVEAKPEVSEPGKAKVAVTKTEERPAVTEIKPVVAPRVSETPVAPAKAEEAPRVNVPGYKESSPSELNNAQIQAGNGKLVIAIGTDIYNMTTITANAGGSIGQMNGKAVVYTILSPEQDASLLDKTETYSVRFVPNDADKASIIMECKKLPSQKAMEGMPKIYIGEILRVLTSK